MDGEQEFSNFISQHWPQLAWLVPTIPVLIYLLKFLAVAYEPVGKLMGSTGERWRSSAERKQRLAEGEVGLLRDEVRSLTLKVDALEKRDAIYWAYVMYDQEWHRDMQVEAMERGFKLKKHLTFLEFRSKWWIERNEQVKSDSESEPDYI